MPYLPKRSRMAAIAFVYLLAFVALMVSVSQRQAAQQSTHCHPLDRERSARYEAYREARTIDMMGRLATLERRLTRHALTTVEKSEIREEILLIRSCVHDPLSCRP